MADFNIRSESVDVEQIMKQIRTRIREKRGVDYTEDQVRELASVRLEKFLDPKNLRSNLLEEFRKSRPALPEIAKDPPKIEPPYTFDDETLFASHRSFLRSMRKLLRPLLKLFFNPNTLNQVLHAQAQFNVDMLKRDARRKVEFQIFERSRAEWNVLYYEVLHNLVLETTRQMIELKNLRMRVESLTSRLDFSERRVRALEGVVQYRPEAVRSRPERVDGRDQRSSRQEPATGEGTAAVETPENNTAAQGLSPDAARRRRRRRRGRRGVGAQPGGLAPVGEDAESNESSMDGGEGELGADSGFDSEGSGADDADIAPGPGENMGPRAVAPGPQDPPESIDRQEPQFPSESVDRREFQDRPESGRATNGTGPFPRSSTDDDAQ